MSSRTGEMKMKSECDIDIDNIVKCHKINRRKSSNLADKDMPPLMFYPLYNTKYTYTSEQLNLIFRISRFAYNSFNIFK
jgi:hypothetical protein